MRSTRSTVYNIRTISFSRSHTTNIVELLTKRGIFDTIEAAKQRCETFAEEHLFRGGAVTGAMFNLRCNYGWDIPRQTIELPAKQIDQERIDRLVASIFEK